MNKQARIVMNGDRVPHTLAADTEVGDLIAAGALVVVAGTSGLTGEEITVYAGGVVVEAQIADDVEVAFGTQLYLDSGALTATTSGSAVAAGKAITVKPSGTAGDIQFILGA